MTGTVVQGVAVAMGNGSYSVGLEVTVSDSYDMTVALPGGNIVASPLTNKIKVVGNMI